MTIVEDEIAERARRSHRCRAPRPRQDPEGRAARWCRTAAVSVKPEHARVIEVVDAGRGDRGWKTWKSPASWWNVRDHAGGGARRVGGPSRTYVGPTPPAGFTRSRSCGSGLRATHGAASGAHPHSAGAARRRIDCARDRSVRVLHVVDGVSSALHSRIATVRARCPIGLGRASAARGERKRVASTPIASISSVGQDSRLPAALCPSARRTEYTVTDLVDRHLFRPRFGSSAHSRPAAAFRRAT
jgi:hypothetical protein